MIRISSERVGVWLIGARGSVATTTISGAAALVAGLVKPTGLVTALEPLTHAPLPRFGDLVFGGHELTETSLLKRAGRLAGEGVLPRRVTERSWCSPSTASRRPAVPST